MRGSPGKFTPEVQAKILNCIRGGNFRTTAAKIAGITDKTFSLWMHSTDKKFADFQKAVIEAEAQVEAACVTKLIESGEKNATWYAWWLERKFKRWNSSVHRWELQLLQKQLKELKNVIRSLTQNEVGDERFADADECPEIRPTETDPERHRRIRPE
jgi:hypothetical protein